MEISFGEFSLIPPNNHEQNPFSSHLVKLFLRYRPIG